jgi:integrase
MNITEKGIAAIEPSAKRQQFMADDLPGFGFRVDPNGRRSFFYQIKHDGTMLFRSLGESPAVSVKDARASATEWAGKVAKWRSAGCPAEANPFAKATKSDVPTFGEAFEKYITDHIRKNSLNPDKAEADRRYLAKKYLGQLADKPLNKITTNDVLKCRAACKGSYGQNSIVETVRAVFNWSSRNFHKCENPAAEIEANRKKSRKRFLQPEELKAFFAAILSEPNRDARDVFVLLLATAARKSNVLGMRWRDVDFKRAVWMIPTSKNGEPYPVTLSATMFKVLKARADELPRGEYVFPADSASGHITDVKHVWGEFRERAGIPDVRLHDLRRTRGSYAAMSGESLFAVGKMLGHKDSRSTQVYAHLNDVALRATSERADHAIEQALLGAGS